MILGTGEHQPAQQYSEPKVVLRARFIMHVIAAFHFLRRVQRRSTSS